MLSSWLALTIGSSRLHWAWFVEGILKMTWDLPHLSSEAIAQLTRSLDLREVTAALPIASPDLPPPGLPLWIASVVPAQTQLWQRYPLARVLTLADVPLPQLYSTLGIDRALALWGAGDRYGFPVLVVDAGTALTLTAADPEGELRGGAILPGVQLQMRSLAEHTALPELSSQDLWQQIDQSVLPPRWAMSTPAAIESGILYTLLAGLTDFVASWRQAFPESAIVFTGGDARLLLAALTQHSPALAAKICLAPSLIFWGMQAAIESKTLSL